MYTSITVIHIAEYIWPPNPSPILSSIVSYSICVYYRTMRHKMLLNTEQKVLKYSLSWLGRWRTQFEQPQVKFCDSRAD